MLPVLQFYNHLLVSSLDGNPNLCAPASCREKKKYIVPVVASVAAVSVILTALAILWKLKWRKQVDKKGSLEFKDRRFSFLDVVKITNNFESVLGNGGFGTVYHGYLDETQVAVKMLSPSSAQGYKEFQAEIKYLYLSWICRKPSSWYLELGRETSNSNRCSKRYFASHRLTEKFDVYSFGVVLLEIITGKRAIENATQGIHISKRVGSMIAKADIRNIIDRRLQGDFDINSVWRAVEIAMVCVSSPSSGRPTMNQVEAELNECLKIEIARKKESPVTESRDPRGMVNLDLHTELFPLAR
ncbi:hypothetical protein Pint_28794 [Pistacia integerrima]|uniref:Uncharacterized protein n=1 Tax=Pistacia integerrima TaxID=434235 RepID=A0ACC0WWV0_9ROSI|nr:hypothetical protein Pint_28794 [Pistacia integerrima]